MRKINLDYSKTPTGEALGKLNEEYGKLQRKLAEDSQVKLEDKEAYMAEAQVLLADVQLKDGVAHENFDSVQMALQLLDNQSAELRKKPIWTKPFKVGSTEKFKRSEVTLESLNRELDTAARELGKVSLVWGFMPGYQLIDGLVNLTGAIPAFSYAFAAFLLALVVRGIVWPLAQRQYMWSRQMSQLQPLVKELKEKYGDKPQEFQMKTMELYKEYGINPMAGCGPALLQMPLFFLVYSCMLRYKFEFQNGTFLWINPSAAEATNGFIAPNLGEEDYILLIIYGVSMIVTTMLQPVSDPANAKQQRIMGVGIAVFFTLLMFTGIFPVPAAFVLYWTFTNMFATFQSLRAYRLPLPPLTKKNTKPGGVFPTMPDKKGDSNGETQIKTDAFKGTGAPKLHKPKKKRK